MAADLAESFRSQAEWSQKTAPLYRRICQYIAGQPDLVDLLRPAPPEQQLPVLLLGVIHDLLLADTTQELAQFYPNLTGRPRTDGLEAVLRAFCEHHAARISELVATRRTQTNEVGRCSLLLPALAIIGDETGPIAHLDVGTSAGLNLQLDRFHYDYVPGGSVGDDSTVMLSCGTRGDVPVPVVMPAFSAHVGLDSHPVDVHDDEQARWLMACVWPDQAERFTRLAAAIELARSVSPTILMGDAVTDLRPAIDVATATGGHPVVTNSWVLNYLSVDEQRGYVEALEEIGAERDLSWVYAEAPALVLGIACSHLDRVHDDEHITVLTMVRWRNGHRDVRRLATAHPHGAWIHWEAVNVR